MTRTPRFVHLLLALISVSLTASLSQAQSGDVGPVVSVTQLKSLLDAGRVRVIEVGQDRDAFENGHLPGAVFVDWVADIIDQRKLERYNLIDKAEMESLMGRLGITPETHVVLYDDLFSRLSTRMYWSMKYYGHDRVHVLDGGRSAWQAGGNSLSQAVVDVSTTNYQARGVNKKYLVDLTYIESHLNEPRVQLVDGRPPAQFTGEEPGRVFHTGKPHKNRGHIPGAVNIFWKDNFNEDGTFRSVDALRELYEQRGVRPGGTVITYCNEGLHAAPPWFVLKELLGYKDVRVYDDSMSEWANEPMPTQVK